MQPGPIASYGGDLAVVAVARAGTPDAAVRRLVRSLRGATDRPARVVVVQSGVAGDVPEGVDVVRLGEDLGRAGAVNRAVAALEPAVGWVAVVDPAVELTAGSLDALVVAAPPRAGAVGPALRDPSGVPVAWSGGGVPSAVDAVRGRRGAPARAGAVGWLPATCLLLRRAALDSVAGFDPRHLGEWADVDLGDRLGRAGWLVVHAPAVEVTVHPDGGTGMLEPRAAGRRRFARDRGSVAVRALAALVGDG